LTVSTENAKLSKFTVWRIQIPQYLAAQKQKTKKREEKYKFE